MTLKIHKISKSSFVDSIEMDLLQSKMTDTCGMTISHYAYSTKQTEATLPYEIEVVQEFVPYINDVEYAISVRKRIDLTATGVNGEIIQDKGVDIGKYDYLDSVPHRPSSLPPGFIELYKG